MFDQTDIYLQIMWLCMDPWNAGKLEEARKLISASNQMWPELGRKADGDGKISKQGCIEAFQAPGFIDGFAIPFQLALFDVRDLDSDGRLSLNEWMLWQTMARHRLQHRPLHHPSHHPRPHELTGPGSATGQFVGSRSGARTPGIRRW
ncbi:hypothetical protein AB0L65_48795 [Nonomuraea sp. NPDC052116]|uniref:hypothetical protein n=1 Tax=Nonomuraea sp. NPDC052116 TaxID=3155665 RepID=UPI003448494C